MLVNCSSNPLKKMGDYWGILHILTMQSELIKFPTIGALSSVNPSPPYNPHQLPNRGGGGANIAGTL